MSTADRTAMVERLVKEELSLSERIEKIQAFIDSQPFQRIAERDQALLFSQDHYMVGYLDTLRKRIDRFNIEGQDSE